jgi:hypothetical protein
MLLIKYENDVVPHSSICPATEMTVGDVTIMVLRSHRTKELLQSSTFLGKKLNRSTGFSNSSIYKGTFFEIGYEST